MKIMEQLKELLIGHSDVLTNAKEALDRALQENRTATDRLRHLAHQEQERSNGNAGDAGNER